MMIDWTTIGYLALLAMVAVLAYSRGWKAGLPSAERVWAVTQDHVEAGSKVTELSDLIKNQTSEQEQTTKHLEALTKKVNSLLVAYVQSGTIKAAKIGEAMIGEEDRKFAFPPAGERPSGPPPADSTQPPSGWGVDPDEMRPHQESEARRRRVSSESGQPI